MIRAPRLKVPTRSTRGRALRCCGHAVFIGVVVSWLSACASTPEPLLIALPAAARGTSAPDVVGAAQPEPGTAGTLLVRRLSLPEYMVARRVRYTTDAARLAEWPNAVWAERVEVGMARELVSALREALPAWRVCDASCGDLVPDITLKVDLQRLDVLRRAGHLIASAQIQLGSSKHGATDTHPPETTMFTFEQSLPADTAQGQAEAMTELVRSIARMGAAAVLHSRAVWPAGPAERPSPR